MNADELRRIWTDFFQAKQHTVVPSAAKERISERTSRVPCGSRPFVGSSSTSSSRRISSAFAMPRRCFMPSEYACTRLRAACERPTRSSASATRWSRLRRGALYTYAEQHGFTKIALGHHRDDLVATFFLNLFHHAKLSGMPPKLLSDDGRHVVIRPLAYVRESDILEYAAAKAFPIIPCNLCGSQENLQRKQVKKMMDAWERETPGRIETIARALGDIRPSQLSDPRLFDFLSLGHRDGATLPDAQAWLAGEPHAALANKDT